MPETQGVEVDVLLERRLGAVAARAPVFPMAIRAYRRMVAEEDNDGADGLIAWLGGQPHVAATVKRRAGIKGDLDHFLALGIPARAAGRAADAGNPGLLLVLDEVETLQRVRSDARAKALNALRQLVDEIHDGHFPGLYLLITGTPAFFDGRQGIALLPPLADRLHTEFSRDPRFDNPRAPQLRLTGFDVDKLVELGGRVRDLFCSGIHDADRVRAVADDAFLRRFAEAVAGKLGGRVGVAPRMFLRKLVDVLDVIELHPDFDPYRDYEVRIAPPNCPTPSGKRDRRRCRIGVVKGESNRGEVRPASVDPGAVARLRLERDGLSVARAELRLRAAAEHRRKTVMTSSSPVTPGESGTLALDGPLPPCVEERVTFLSPHELHFVESHPTDGTTPCRTCPDDELTMPAWSVHTTPYYWMMARARRRTHGAGADSRLCPQNRRRRRSRRSGSIRKSRAGCCTVTIRSDDRDVLSERRHRRVAGVLLPAKLSVRRRGQDARRCRPRRLGAAAGAVADRQDRPRFPNHMWETTVRHTLRPDGTGGILLPLQELAAAGRRRRRRVVGARAACPSATASSPTSPNMCRPTPRSRLSCSSARPPTRRSHWAVPCRPSRSGGSMTNCTPRGSAAGIAPGLPAVLGRLGFEYPTYAARSSPRRLRSDGRSVADGRGGLDGNPPGGPAGALFTTTRQRIWRKLDSDDERDALRSARALRLDTCQVAAVLDGETAIPIEPGEVLEDPYYLVTCTLDDDDPIPFDVVDRGCFGSPELLAAHPLPVTEPLDDPVDVRRVEALIATNWRRGGGGPHRRGRRAIAAARRGSPAGALAAADHAGAAWTGPRSGFARRRAASELAGDRANWSRRRDRRVQIALAAVRARDDSGDDARR